ncbi:MAG TPA: carboxylating nicotinate-nucleotide diphosphorylase, partial [Gemmatimonadales bacterium]|nr:carboxylating nicotinate-nucleotide diphosphorylase [Gemmatimonadales bacterium]
TACSLPPIEWHVVDGERLDAGQVIGRIRGSLRDILRAERPLLNMLQRAAGIATMTRQAVDLTSGTGCVVLHTRKTTPGLRLFEVRAVLDGGGGLHRLDLATTAMIKDNHWQALKAGGKTLAQGISAARAMGVSEIQVEVESIEQLVEACRAGATRVMIDNQPATTVREWSDRARRDRRDIQVEATGGISIDNIREYALAGVDFVSVGFITHSVRSADLGVEIA